MIANLPEMLARHRLNRLVGPRPHGGLLIPDEAYPYAVGRLALIF